MCVKIKQPSCDERIKGMSIKKATLFTPVKYRINSTNPKYSRKCLEKAIEGAWQKIDDRVCRKTLAYLK